MTDAEDQNGSYEGEERDIRYDTEVILRVRLRRSANDAPEADPTEIATWVATEVRGASIYALTADGHAEVHYEVVSVGYAKPSS